MFRRRSAKGGWRTRVGVFAYGVLALYMGAALLKRGIFVWHNGYGMEVYSPALAATGFVLMLVALVPDFLVRWFVKRHNN